jgi:hypothetical protein
MDPRVTTPPAELALQHELAMRIVYALERSRWAPQALGPPSERAEAEPASKRRELAEQLTRSRRQLTQLLDMVDGVDAAPTPAVRTAVDETIAALEAQLVAWRALEAEKKETP